MGGVGRFVAFIAFVAFACLAVAGIESIEFGGVKTGDTRCRIIQKRNGILPVKIRTDRMPKF